jgi:hemolysin III
MAPKRADVIVQLVNLGLALTGSAVLFAVALPRADPVRLASLTIYALAMLAMFAFSTLYGIGRDGPWHDRFRHLDHAGIFLMIAGTYTPFTLVSIGGPRGAMICAAVWAVAFLGLAVKFAAPERFERLAIPLYLLLGCSAGSSWRSPTRCSACPPP